MNLSLSVYLSLCGLSGTRTFRHYICASDTILKCQASCSAEREVDLACLVPDTPLPPSIILSVLATGCLFFSAVLVLCNPFLFTNSSLCLMDYFHAYHSCNFLDNGKSNILIQSTVSHRLMLECHFSLFGCSPCRCLQRCVLTT